MPSRQPMEDLVVVIPGITGSVLADEAGDVWAISGKAVARGLLSRGRVLQRLALPQGIGHDDADDGMRPVRLMSDVHLLPGVWSPIKGYSGLLAHLGERFELAIADDGRPTNLLPFPYDWRVSNVASARRLKQLVRTELERWRDHSGHADAKVVFVCHSMGGLVARYYIEVLGGLEVTRRLVTLGTPYQGAIKALETLVNAESKGLGRVRIDLTEVVRSFPSVHELLPVYPCLEADGNGYTSLDATPPPGLNSQMLAAATAFHRAIADAVDRRSEPYEILAIKGINQPTTQSARLADGKIEPIQAYGGTNRGGDGTVPRPSAHPPEWAAESGGAVVSASQRHAWLQETSTVYDQLFQWFTDRLGVLPQDVPNAAGGWLVADG